MKSNSSDKIRLIAEDNGLPGTLNKLAEECAEYSAARLKYILGECEEEKWISELADVMICILQVEIHLVRNPLLRAKLEEEIERKVDRQIRRINDEKA